MKLYCKHCGTALEVTGLSKTPPVPEQDELVAAGMPSKRNSAVLLLFQCSGTPDEWELTGKHLSAYHKLYGDQINVGKEAEKARQWIADNPTRRKTAKGMSRFLGGWFSRTVDSGKGAPPVHGRELKQQAQRMAAAVKADREQGQRASVATMRGAGRVQDIGELV